MLKSEIIERKFISQLNVNDYEIEADEGFVDIKMFCETIPYLKYIIKTNNGKVLECADKHIVFNNNLDEVFVDELSIGDYIYTNDGIEKVVEIINTETYENMFDLQLDDNSKHRYYTNGILSHNTLIAKKLAKELFGTEKALVRFDMSEYNDKTSVNKLIGSNPGYVGYDEGGQLTEIIKNKKYCVILLDEIEKADPEIYNIFLQVLDEGFLTDNTGQKIDFKNTIILFTSNVGTKIANDFAKGLAFDSDPSSNKKRLLTKELKKKFPPEFLNRLDNVIYFNSLTEEDLKKIIKLELKKLNDKMNRMQYKLEYNVKTVDYILNIIKDDKEYGARPIIRTIQDEIENKITDMIIENEYSAGQTFYVEVSDSSTELNKLEIAIYTEEPLSFER